MTSTPFVNVLSPVSSTILFFIDENKQQRKGKSILLTSWYWLPYDYQKSSQLLLWQGQNPGDEHWLDQNVYSSGPSWLNCGENEWRYTCPMVPSMILQKKQNWSDAYMMAAFWLSSTAITQHPVKFHLCHARTWILRLPPAIPTTQWNTPNHLSMPLHGILKGKKNGAHGQSCTLTSNDPKKKKTSTLSAASVLQVLYQSFPSPR